MPKRSLLLITSLTLVLAACGGTADTTTDATDPAPTSTTEPQVATPEATRLSYSLVPGATFAYEVEIDQRMELTTTGDASALGEEGVPGEFTMEISGTSTFNYAVADGPEEGTFAVTISGDLTGLDFTATLDGEPADPDDVPDFAGVGPFEVTLIVDEQGNPVTDDDDFDDLFGGIFGGLEGLGSLGTADLELGRFFGPPLSDDEVEVGDSWSETIETPMFDDDDPVTTTFESQVSRADSLDGVDVLVIETTVTTSAISFDLAEFIIGMFEAFLPPEAGEEELAELEAITSQLRWLIEVDASVSTMTTWFDPDSGTSRMAQFSGANQMVMDMNIPDEDTGEMLSFGLVMKMSQTMGYRLVGASDA